MLLMHTYGATLDLLCGTADNCMIFRDRSVQNQGHKSGSIQTKEEVTQWRNKRTPCFLVASTLSISLCFISSVPQG